MVLYQLFRIGIHLKNIIQLWKKKCAKKYNSIKIVTKHQKLSYSICFSTSIWNKIPFHQLKRLQQLLIPIDLHHILHGQPPIAEIPPPRSLLPQFSRLGPHSLSVGLLHGHPPPPILHTPKQSILLTPIHIAGQAILRRLDGPREALLKALASPDNVVHLLEGAEAAVGEADRVEVHFGVVLLFEVSSFDESAQFVYILELDRVGE